MQAATYQNGLLGGYSPRSPDQPCDQIVQKAEPDLLQAPAQLERQITAPGEVLFESPQGFWLAPSIWNGELYGPSVHDANWHFTQWQTPGADFRPFSGLSTATASGRVTDLGGQWEIAQNGKNLPPGDEFSIFAEANRSHVYPNYRPAAEISAPISQMEYLHHSIGFMAKYEHVADDDYLNQGGFLTAVVLRNIDNGNTFFYQLELRPVNKSPCQNWWDWSGPLWGYSDAILIYGKSIPPIGRRAFFHLDLLPRLKAVLQNASNGIDTNFSHWVVSGSYHGSHIWGDVRLTGVWDSFSLRTKYKDE